MKKRYLAEDIHTDIRDYADRYIKTVLTNAKNDHFRSTRKLPGAGAQRIDFDECESEWIYEELGFENPRIYYIHSCGKQIAFCSADLVKALLELPEKQRDVLLQSTVLCVPIKQLADKYGVSSPMISKSKKQALDFLRKRLDVDDKKEEKHPSASCRYRVKHSKR